MHKRQVIRRFILLQFGNLAVDTMNFKFQMKPTTSVIPYQPRMSGGLPGMFNGVGGRPQMGLGSNRGVSRQSAGQDQILFYLLWNWHFIMTAMQEKMSHSDCFCSLDVNLKFEVCR